ncbi:MAG: molecular chaperone GroEL [Candidatus Howiella sp.]
MMSYINPKLRTQFESLSVDLKNEILSRNVRIETLQDLIGVLEQISSEA